MNSIMSSTSSTIDGDSTSKPSSSQKQTDNKKPEQQQQNQNQKSPDDELKEEDIFVNEPVSLETIRHLKFRINKLEHLLLDASAALKESSGTKNSNNGNEENAVCDQLRHDLIQSLQAEKELQIELSKCKSSSFESGRKQQQQQQDQNHDLLHHQQQNDDENKNKNNNHDQPLDFDELLKQQREKERKQDEENENNANHNYNNKEVAIKSNIVLKSKDKQQQQQQSSNNNQKFRAEQSGGRIVKGPGPDPSNDEYGTIPILVLSYNRPKLLSRLLARIQELLLNTHKKHGVDQLPPFRVFVSQDFDGAFPDVTAEIQEAQTRTRKDLGIVFMMHNRDDSGATPQEESNGWKSYYAISQHYAWAIAQTFGMNERYRRVIILEEDLELAFDFFAFMAGMAPVFDKDPSLYCVSGFNDNGKAALVEDSSAVYRSDFFPGLGWMMSRSLWEEELRPKWPKGFWDDWMRQPAQRRGRSCLRPEISRSKPTCEDGEGASQGQFCGEHLKQIVLNDPLRSKLVHWNNFNLDALLPQIYDSNLKNEVHRAKTVYNVQSIFGSTQGGSLDSSEVKLTYSSNDEFVVLAHALNLMDDFKDGVPRTAYQGIVTIKWRQTTAVDQFGNNNRRNGYKNQIQDFNNNNNNNVMFSNKADEEDVRKIRKVHLVSDHLLYENSQKN